MRRISHLTVLKRLQTSSIFMLWGCQGAVENPKGYASWISEAGETSIQDVIRRWWNTWIEFIPFQKINQKNFFENILYETCAPLTQTRVFYLSLPYQIPNLTTWLPLLTPLTVFPDFPFVYFSWHLTVKSWNFSDADNNLNYDFHPSLRHLDRGWRTNIHVKTQWL